MIKWFCDICEKEILAPQSPTRVAAYRCTKARNDPSIGWSENDDIIQLFAHEKCADELEAEIKHAVVIAKSVTKNNA